MAPTESLDRVSTAPSLSAAQAIPGVDLSRLPLEKREEVARALQDTTVAGRLGFNDPAAMKITKNGEVFISAQDDDRVERKWAEDECREFEEMQARNHELVMGFVGGAGAIKAEQAAVRKISQEVAKRGLRGTILYAGETLGNVGENVLRAIEDNVPGLKRGDLDKLRVEVPRAPVDYIGKPLSWCAEELKSAAKAGTITEGGRADYQLIRSIEKTLWNDRVPQIRRQIGQIEKELSSGKPDVSFLMRQIDNVIKTRFPDLLKVEQLARECSEHSDSIVRTITNSEGKSVNNREMKDALLDLMQELRTTKDALQGIKDYLRTAETPVQEVRDRYIALINTILKP